MSSCRTEGPIDGQALKHALAAAIQAYPSSIELINNMNVFPVPDGDTGINMYHTLKRAYTEIAEEDSVEVSYIAQRFAYGALMGARGNSGTILSQLLKGFADELQTTDMLTTQILIKACRGAVKMAYAAVAKPVEGTILTVAREAAEELERQACKDLSIEDALNKLLGAAQASLDNTPLLLPILHQAGVVDAGGLGLVTFLRGLSPSHQAAASWSPRNHDNARMADFFHNEGTSSYGYDVQFLMLGKAMNIEEIRRDLEKIGWSVLVVGDQSTLKVHIHVDNPAHPLDYAIKAGVKLDDIVVENMQRQFLQIMHREAEQLRQVESSAEQYVAVISIVTGRGIDAVFQEMGSAANIAGGQGTNPSTEDILEAINRLSAEHVIILPNNPNIALTARQAADLCEGKIVHVLATATVAQGISAMVAFGGAVERSDNIDCLIDDMTRAARQIVSIEVTRATRSSELLGVRINEGDFLAIVDGKIRASSASADAAVIKAFTSFDTANHELATIYFGDEMKESDAQNLIRRLTDANSDLEYELVYGGQALYPYLIGVE